MPMVWNAGCCGGDGGMTMGKLYTLTDEHKAKLDGWAQKWIRNALKTGPSGIDLETIAAFDRAVEEWHAADTEQTVYEWLGMDEHTYWMFVKGVPPTTED